MSEAEPSKEAPQAGHATQCLPLVVTVGFAGHRAVDDPARLGRLLDKAYQVIDQALAALPQHPLDGGHELLSQAYEGAQRARFLSGSAPGADRLAVARWRSKDRGGVHALFPFRDAELTPLSDHPDEAGEDEQIKDLSQFDAWSGFDAVGLGMERDQAHAELGRWIVRHSDLLVVFWNGDPAKGLGGTGDTVRRALERGLPVIWLEPGKDVLRMMEPHQFQRHSQLDEAIAAPQTIAVPLTAEKLLAALIGPFAPPPSQSAHGLDPEVLSRKDYADRDPLRRRVASLHWLEALLDKTAWRAFADFKGVMGDIRHWRPPEGLGPIGQGQPDAAEAETLAGLPGLKPIEAAFEIADHRATHLSAIHRSQQLLLIYIAVLAVTVGAAPALLPREYTHLGHIVASALELVLGIFAATITSYALRAHRHRRWSDARRLAERLRAARATWPLGVDLADLSERAASTWTEWRARAVLRDAGPPTGWLDKPAFDHRADSATRLLIDGQIRYHSREHYLAETIERRVKAVEGVAFTILMISMTLFLGGWFAASRKWLQMPEWPVGPVTFISAVSPAIGAACLALEATNGFGEVVRRSSRMGPEFVKLRTECLAHHPLSLHHTQEVLRSAAQLLVEDADSWRDRVVSRRIVRAG